MGHPPERWWIWELSYVPDDTVVDGFRYEPMFFGVNFLQQREDATKPWEKVRCLGRRAVQGLINKYRQQKNASITGKGEKG